MTCAAHEATGHACAEPALIRIEWMPRQHHRDSHVAAGSRGTYPFNGAIRFAACAGCGESLLESDPEWTCERPRAQWVVACYRTSAGDESVVARAATRTLAIARAIEVLSLDELAVTALLAAGECRLPDGTLAIIAPEVSP